MFEGRTEEALEFYKGALGAEVIMLLRFKDNPEPPQGDCPPSPPDKVMHSQVRIGNTTVMMSDGRCTGTRKFDGFALTFNATTQEEANKAFGALADGGEVMMPLGKTFFSPCFGMVTDRFGVMWMILTASN
jgi:PhnB protein